TISFRLMTSYMQAPYTFQLQKNTAELLRNVGREVNVLIRIVVTNLLKMRREGVMALGILTCLFSIEPFITAMVIVLSGLGAGTFILLNRKKLKEYGRKEQQHQAEIIKTVNQGLGGIKEARVLNREKEFIEKFRIELYDATRLMAYTKFIMQIPRPVVETTAVMGMLLIAVILVLQGRDMTAIIPILTLFAMATVRLMPSIQQLVAMYTNLRYNMVAIEPVYDDLTELSAYNAKFVKDRKSN